jgi:vacuolar protein-sorting-associated protein 4
LPDSVARKEILKIHLGNETLAVDQNYLDKVAQKTEGYSGADINIIVRDVLMAPVRDALRATHWKKV